MATFVHGLDPEMPGSRFTRRPALAVASRAGGASVNDENSDRGNAQAVIGSVIDDELLNDDETLGRARVVDGSSGRGADAWVPVVEWLADAIGSGVVGAGVSLALYRAGLRLRGLREKLQDQGVQFMVSRGAAEALAVEHIVSAGIEAQGSVDIEAAVEPSRMGGGEPTELGYVGVEPWLVSLLNADRTKRHLVAIGPDGAVIGVFTMPLSEFEWVYLPQRE